MAEIEIRTARLLLRPMRADDSDALFEVFGDPVVMVAFDRGPFDRAEMEAWVARNREHQRRHGVGLFTVALSGSGEVIGDCGLERIELDGRVDTELGYDLRRDQWGKGLATEAAAAVARYAFEELELTRLISLIRVANERSARVARRIGMVLDGQTSRDGVDYDEYVLDAPGPSAG